MDIPNRRSPAADGLERADPLAFRVVVDWQSVDQVSVSVWRGAVVLTDRTIEVGQAAGPVHAKLTLWLLLKSTIERYRGLVGAAPKEVASAQHDDTTAVSAAQPEGSRLADADAGQRSARSTAVAQRAKVGATVTAAPAPGIPLRLTWGALVTLWLETPRLLAVGIAGLATWRGETVALGLQLGYRFAPGPDGLAVHALPLTATASAEMGDRVRAGVGVMLTGELKVPTSSAGVGLGLGAEAGLYAQARVEFTASSLAFLRFAHAWRMTRMEVRYHDSRGIERKTTEAPWISMVTTGVEWL